VRAARAAGEEAKLIVAAAIDAHVEHVVQQLKQADDTLLGGEADAIAMFMQAQLQQAVAAAENPPPSAFPCIPESQAALALAAAYMTSEMKPLSAVAQFCPTDKEQFRTKINQMLPPVGHIRIPVPSSPPRIHDCDMPTPPLPHFDFSQFPAVPSFDFGGVAEALGEEKREVKGVRGDKNAGRGGPARHAVDRGSMNAALQQQQTPHRFQLNSLPEPVQHQSSSNSNSAAALFLHPRDSHSGTPRFGPGPCAFSVGGGSSHTASNDCIGRLQHALPATSQPSTPVFGGSHASHFSGNPVCPHAPGPALLPFSQPAAAGALPLPGKGLKQPLRCGSVFFALLLILTLFQGANAAAAGPDDDEACMLQRRSHQRARVSCAIMGL
jgi:hypothetical protein